MKKVLVVILSLIMILSLAACGINRQQRDEVVNSIEKIETIASEKEGYDTYKISFKDGSSTTVNVLKGETHVPEIVIGENGNWFVDGVDTNIKANGEGADDPKNLDYYLQTFKQNLSNFTVEETILKDAKLLNREVYEIKDRLIHWTTTRPEKNARTKEYDHYKTDEYYIEVNGRKEITDYIYYYPRLEKWYSTSDKMLIEVLDLKCKMRHYGLEMNSEYYEKIDEGVYRAKEEYVDQAGKEFYRDRKHDAAIEEDNVIWHQETFTSLVVEFGGGNIHVTAKSTGIVGKNTYTYDYDTLVCKISATNPKLPEYSEPDDEVLRMDSIDDCLKMNDGDPVYQMHGVVHGYIASGKSYDVYLSNGYRSHIIVTFENMDISEDIFVGDTIYVWGTITIVDGVPRVKVTRKADWKLWYTSSGYPSSFDSLEDIDDGQANAVVDLKGVVLSDSYVSENDKYVVVKDRMQNVMPLIIGSKFADMFNELFEDYDDEEIVLKNVAVMKSDGRLYLQLIEQSSIEPQHGLIVSYTRKKIRTGVTLEEALEDLKVKYRFMEDDVDLEKGQYKISCPDFDSTKSGKYKVTISYERLKSIVWYAFITITVTEPSNKENVEYETISDVAYKYGIPGAGLPSVGDVNILVIPIGFENSDYGTDEEIKAKLEKAFNGTEEDTGWHSLSSYYRTVSYNKLNLHADILDVYQTNQEYDLKSGIYGEDDYTYLWEALFYYDDEIDYTRYDQNNDGYIDCVYLIYLAPYKQEEDETGLWWAYCYTTNSKSKFDNLQSYYYFWASIEFFDESLTVGKNGDDYIYAEINCETIIHETGHALGLDDYYDYDITKDDGCLGCFVMMDANAGDHDPYSKAILGWINPTVVETDSSYALRSFEKTGDSIIISKENKNTFFAEYYIIEFYTPTGVNEYKKDDGCGIPSESGIVVWHVSAELDTMSRITSRENVWDITRYDNGRTEHKLITIACADGSTDIDEDYYYVLGNKDLYHENSIISGLEWYDGTKADFSISVGTFSEVDGVEQAELEIHFN